MNCLPSHRQHFGKEPAPSQCSKTSQENGRNVSKGLSKILGRCSLDSSTYFLPLACPPSIERTWRGLADALGLRPGVWVALRLSDYFVCSHLTVHIPLPHALATGHGTLRRQGIYHTAFSLAMKETQCKERNGEIHCL